MPFGLHLNDMRELMVLQRYQNRFMHKRRSVAEHMCSTAMIAQWLLIFEENIFKNEVDKAEVMQRAINFNATQYITGNMLNSNSKISPTMEEVKASMKRVVYFDYIKPTLPVSWGDRFERFTISAKDNSYEGRIVQAADALDTVLECIEEIKLHNREPFKTILKETVNMIIDMDLPSLRYAIKYIIPFFGVDESIYGERFIEYQSSLKFGGIDSGLLESYAVSGEYIYQYRNLMDLMRYQNKFMFKRTSVVEHMWFVAKVSQGLAIWTEEKFGKKVDMYKVICTALGHDYSEFVTGDILSTTKRMTCLMRKAVDEMEEVAFIEHIAPLIPKGVLEQYKQYILYPKENTIEGRILAAADVIDTVYECAGEVKLGNTEIFGPILKNVTKALLNVELEAKDYFLEHSLNDLGLKDIEKYYGVEVFEHIKCLNKRSME